MIIFSFQAALFLLANSHVRQIKQMENKGDRDDERNHSRSGTGNTAVSHDIAGM